MPNTTGLDAEHLREHGFVPITFRDARLMTSLKSVVAAFLPVAPDEWHTLNVAQDDWIRLTKQITDKVVETDIITELLRGNAEPFEQLFGPDVDVQRVPHVRMSRPDTESDLIDWHRDTFYGNTPWELNLWFPVFPLRDGAGLRLLPGSHRRGATGVRPVQDTDAFRRTVTKGSAANEIGYLYQPKTDDTIDRLTLEQTTLLAPKVGEAILFFGSTVHKAQNRSTHTRVSMDVRLRNMHAPTSTKPGYYRPLLRGPVQQSIDEYLAG